MVAARAWEFSVLSSPGPPGRASLRAPAARPSRRRSRRRRSRRPPAPGPTGALGGASRARASRRFWGRPSVSSAWRRSSTRSRKLRSPQPRAPRRRRETVAAVVSRRPEGLGRRRFDGTAFVFPVASRTARRRRPGRRARARRGARTADEVAEVVGPLLGALCVSV